MLIRWVWVAARSSVPMGRHMMAVGGGAAAAEHLGYKRYTAGVMGRKEDRRQMPVVWAHLEEGQRGQKDDEVQKGQKGRKGQMDRDRLDW